MCRYQDQEIGISLIHATRFDPARLMVVAEDSFTVTKAKPALSYTVPFGSILRIVSGEGGVQVKEGFRTTTYPILVEVFHLIVYKRGSSAGFAISFLLPLQEICLEPLDGTAERVVREPWVID